VTNSADAVELIQSVEQADSPARLVAAVRSLAAAKLEAGIPTLITILGYNNPEAAVVALEGLVQLGDVAVLPLLEQLDDYNYGARAYSFRALAAIADPQALEKIAQCC
jgi:phycocyanobilin lyase beta subunit